MATLQLHPETTADPTLLRWVIGARHLPHHPPELTALVDDGVLDRVEIAPGEVRTWLSTNRSWVVDGPRVRTALFAALSGADDAPALQDHELADRIAEILRTEVAPVAESHGGAVTVDSVRDGVLTVELSGTCRGCSLRARTIGDLVARSVQARYPQIREVRTASPRRVWLTLPRRREAE